MNTAEFIDSVETQVHQFEALLDASTPLEIIVALLIPSLAVLISIWVNRAIDNWPKKNLHTRFLDFAGPLLSPILAILFTAIAIAVFVNFDLKPRVLPFAFKLFMAWLAIHGSILLLSGRAASWFIAIVILPVTVLQMFGLWQPIVVFSQDLKFSIGSINLNLYLIFKGVIMLIILLWMIGLIIELTETRLRKVRMRASSRTLILKMTQIVLYFIAFMFILQVLGVSLAAFSIVGGALGVGIGFGLQKITSNFISGIILLFERSIEIGDLIELADGTQGFVRQTSARYTLIQTANGKDVMIPNEEFITQRVNSLTHTSTNGRVEIPVGIDYGCDVELALKLMIDAAKSVSRCAVDPAPNSFFVAFADSSINLILYFWVENIADGTLVPKTEAAVAMIKLFDENNITFAYPHQVAVSDPTLERRITALEQQTDSVKPAAAAKPTKDKETSKPATKGKKSE
jgi:small-conductance mechanosensitive channel